MKHVMKRSDTIDEVVCEGHSVLIILHAIVIQITTNNLASLQSQDGARRVLARSRGGGVKWKNRPRVVPSNVGRS